MLQQESSPATMYPVSAPVRCHTDPPVQPSCGPCKPPPHTTASTWRRAHARAREAFERTRSLPQPCRQERETFITRVANGLGGKMSDEDLDILARLSTRNLSRLPKRRLFSEDQIIVELLKKMNKSSKEESWSGEER